jgi:putative PEP-CTERM system TPR-repeat lipoprotein
MTATAEGTLMRSRSMPRLLLAAALAALLAGCGSHDPATLIASGKSYLDKGDLPAAIIQLRNAREKAPDNAEVRYLLGRALLASGDPTSAEADLRRALELKHPADQVLPPLAQAMVALGEHRKVIQDLRPDMVTTPQAKADLGAALAAAHLARGDDQAAAAAVEAALAAQPRNPRVLLVKAQVAARAKDVAGAEAAVEAALAVAPGDTDALTMKASLLAARGQRDEAIKLLQQAIASDPSAVGTRFALVSMMITQGKVKEAGPLIEGLKKDAPKDFRTRYAEALLALSRGQAAQARDIVQPLLAARPDHLGTLFVAALAYYELGNYALAEDAARKVVAQAPADPAPRRLLASTYLKTGRSAQAAEVAEEGLARIPDDPGLLRLAGEARMSAGQVPEAARHFERAAATEKQGSAARLRLAEVRLATGDTGRALADLEQLSKADSSQIQADLALVAAHLRRREFDKALAAIGAIEKKQPNTALPQELEGTVYAAKRDYPNARKHLGKALELEPARLSAARSLAIIDLQEGKVGDARARYEKIIALEPKNERPLLALAELLAVSGAPPAEVRTVIERAIAVNPAAPGPHLALVQQLRRIGDNKGALEAARAAVTALPSEGALLETLGALEVQQGEVAQARETFNKLARLQPSNPVPILRLSETYVADRDFTTALDLQRKALALQPDNTTTLVTLATTQLIAGKPDEAIAEARRLQKERPRAAVGYLLESELLAAQKKPAEAAAAMKEALERSPTGMFAARSYVLLAQAGKPAEAKALAARWAKDHPDDASFPNLLGQYLQSTNDQDGATASYRAALAIEPDNVVVLNNLAWLLNERGRPEAREYAERAYRLAPLNASIVDTYGVVLMKQGDTKRGLEMLRIATRLAPADPRLRISLARALVATGDKAGAKRELEVAMQADARLPARAEAEKMLREL